MFCVIEMNIEMFTNISNYCSSFFKKNYHLYLLLTYLL